MKYVLTFALLVGSCFGAVTFDAVSAAQNGTTSPFTWTHTGTGSNLIAFVACATGADSVTIAVTYGGFAMTSIAKVHSNNQTAGFVQLFVLLAPPSGAQTVSVSGNGGNNTEAASITFAGADQATGWQHLTTSFGSTNPISMSVLSASGNMVLDTAANGSAITSSSQTSRIINNHDLSSAAGNHAVSTAAGAASVTMGYVITADWWGEIAVDIKAAGGAAPSCGQSISLMGVGCR